jgi:hypothetical protein
MLVKGVGEYCEIGESLLSPHTFFTKICMVSTSSGETDREIDAEGRMLRAV